MSARRARPARGKRRGRGWAVVGLALVVFVLIGAGVVWRRSRGIAQARELTVLVRRRDQLVSERAALRGAVRLAASRPRIVAVAEARLGMRIPADTQMIFVSRRDSSSRAPR